MEVQLNAPQLQNVLTMQGAHCSCDRKEGPFETEPGELAPCSIHMGTFRYQVSETETKF